MTSMLLLGLLAPNGSGGTNDGVLNLNTTPLLLPTAYHHYIRCSGLRVQARARAQSRSLSTRQGRSRDATLTRPVRFTLSCALQMARSSRSTRRARARAPTGHPAIQHQSRQARPLVTTTTRAGCFTVSCAVRPVPLLPSTSRCRHRSRPGYLRR